MTSSSWLPIEQLAEQLLCSERMIYQFKADGVFVAGKHFYSIGNGSIRGRCVYSLEACRQALLDRTKELKKNRATKTAETYDEQHINQLLATKKAR